MNKKSKKVEIQLADTKVEINNAKVGGYTLTAGKKIIGEITELDGKFAIVKSGEVEAFFRILEQTIESIIENYNLNCQKEPKSICKRTKTMLE